MTLVLSTVFLILGMLFILVPIGYCIYRKITKKPIFRFGAPRLIEMLLLSVLVFMAMFSFQRCADIAGGGYNAYESFFHSVSVALQTFGLNTSYGDILANKDVIRLLFGDVISNVYNFAFSSVSFLAPILGGVILFELLAKAFPRIRLVVINRFSRREKHYFSSLTPSSVALAKSITEANPSAVIIFSDVYLDNGDEDSSEIYFEAKKTGAICIKEDIVCIEKAKKHSRKFYLCNEDESTNLHALAQLCTDLESIKSSEIYLFTDSDSYVPIEKSIYESLGETEKTLFPTIVPINTDRNLVSNLIVRDIPLFEPLVGKAKDENGQRELNVSVLGTGRLGTEFFLAVYWCGQMLDCRLNVNIFSSEPQGDFMSRIDYINPEILRTAEVNGEIPDDGRLLRIYSLDGSDTRCSAPYCHITYTECDVKSSEITGRLYCAKDGDPLLCSDYIFAALGSDEENVSIAQTLCRYISKYHMTKDVDTRTVISYVVFDPELSSVLNGKARHESKNGVTDIIMHATGSIDEIYSVRNIFMTDYLTAVVGTDKKYNTVGRGVPSVSEGQKKRHLDDYKYRASLARAMHRKYKMFSLGLIDFSRFDTRDTEEYDRLMLSAYEGYKALASGHYDRVDGAVAENYHKCVHRLARLEHRRWNAFTRICGLRAVYDYSMLRSESNLPTNRDMNLRLHACLVECDDKGCRIGLDDKYTPASDVKAQLERLLADVKSGKVSELDLLDRLTLDSFEKGICDYDYKQYDYPPYDSFE